MTLPPAPFAFVDAALDRADHLRGDADALAAQWGHARILLIDGEGRALVGADNVMFAPDGAQVGGGPGAAVFLGLQGQQAWFAAQADTIELDAPQRIDLRSAAALWSPFEATLFAQARAMLHWRARHRHCGACGGEIAFVRAGWCGHCLQCNAEHYPRTDPAVIVAVTDGERLLLGRQASWPARRYSTLAGFVEPGESLEQAIAREVFEESGVRVRNSRYLASQPWPFPGSLMLGFTADAEPDVPQVGDELEDARWFGLEEIGRAIGGASRDDELLLSPSISISRWLVECWYADVTSRGPDISHSR
ncbi:MAG: NAD(+) diphosphatase [Lysobacter sp.]|nr:NAD(+) diphosphatase [Lysobacter sp.]